MNKPQLLAGFAVKVLMGLLYGYVFLHYYNGDDTWRLFRASLRETQILLNHPRLFFINEFTPENALKTGKDAWEIISVYLNDLQYVLVVKTQAVMNLVTRGNYYLNVVLFNAITFLGHYWLFRMMTEIFPAKRNIYFVVIFLFLPAVFWLSGLRVDGWLFFFLSLFLYNACRRKSNILLALTGFAGVVICRPQVAVLCAIAVLAWFLSKKTKKAIITFVTVYLVATMLFFISGLQDVIVSKQNEFSQLKGTTFGLEKIDSSPGSFLSVLPQAIGNTFMRPYPWETNGMLQLMASGEVIAFWLIVIASIYYRHEYWKLRLTHPVILMMLALGITTYIFIGYIVPFPGAIIRYKCIPEMLILCAVVSISRWGESTNYKKL